MSKLIYQVRPRSIICYNKREGDSGRTLRQINSAKNFLKSKTYGGLMTKGSQKRVTKSINQLIEIAQFKPLMVDGREYMWKLNFITLTLYNFGTRIPGKEAHKLCLEPLLLFLRRHYGMKNYIWKAELQMKRSDCHQLHYHITTDVFIDCHELRTEWNRLQAKAGYLDSFYRRHRHFNPNSTDIHCVYNKKNLVGYIKKCMNKYSDKRAYARLKHNVTAEMGKAVQNWYSVEGKVWDCSKNLKVMGFFEVVGYQDITAEIAKGIARKELFENRLENCTIYECLHKFDSSHYIPYRDKVVYANYKKYLREWETSMPKIPKDMLQHILSTDFVLRN